MSRKDFILLTLFRATRSVSAGMIMIVFPYLVLQRLRYGPLTLGLLYVAGALATAALGLLIGALGDAWGRKPALLVAGALLPVSSLLVFLSGHLWVLMLAAAFGGYSATGSLAGGGIGGAAAPIQSAVIADLSARDKRTFYYSTFSFLSGAFGAVGSLTARLFDVHDAFLWATLIAAAGVPLVAWLGVEDTPGRLSRLRSKVVIGQFSLTGMLNGFAGGLIVPFLIPFFVLVYSLPKSSMAVYGFIAGLLASVTLLAAPALERWLGFVKSIAWTRGIGTAMLVLMPLVRWLPLSLAIYILTPALRIAAVPVQQAALAEMVVPEERGRALAANQVARLGASSAAIAFTGWMFDTAEIALPFFVYAAVMSGNIYLYFRFFSAWEARGEEAHPGGEANGVKRA
ncbi:MAG TPA: MFS transporter [Candidatus Acidoferrales bacterium]|nr:MFS transporter [Candidatus Acidoferrales bacterium]